MKKASLALLLLAIALAAWWQFATPPPHLQVGAPILFDGVAAQAAAAVDRSADFAAALQVLPSALPGHDDLLFLDDGKRILASGMDGQIWEIDSGTQQARPFLDAPLMAAGMHESPGDHDEVFFCASRLWGDTYPAGERVGLYRLRLSSRTLTPVVLDVPDTTISGERVWALDDPKAPRLGPGGGNPARPLAFCNDLEISEDGRRIYFTEPFSYEGASMGGGTVPEVIAYHGNGRVWMHDLATAETRLVAEGYFFPDGILYDLHAGQAREQSLLVSQTAGFRIIRFHLAGSKAGSAELVQDGLTGLCDGMDRDARGRIWCGMYTQRSGLLTWLHAHPWIKHLLLRLPLNWMQQPRATGVLALTPDASRSLYSAWYEGPKAVHIASALPGPDGGIYLTPFSKAHRGLVRLPDPLD